MVAALSFSQHLSLITRRCAMPVWKRASAGPRFWFSRHLWVRYLTYQGRGQRCRLPCSTTGGHDRTKGLSTTEWQQWISPRTSCATSASGDTQLPAKSCSKPTTSGSANVRILERLRKYAGCPKMQGGNEHKPMLEVWDWQVCCLCWFQIYTGQTDRQTISYGAFRVNVVPSATFEFPLALKPNSALMWRIWTSYHPL